MREGNFTFRPSFKRYQSVNLRLRQEGKEPPPSLSPLSSSGSGRRERRGAGGEGEAGEQGGQEGGHEGGKEEEAVIYCVHQREKQPFRLL